ncbi:hypothetical protein Acr_14g0005830 [Actinidia rufa]|uniref:Uncharacterized protein n=1 Tax=Actinidia rufa TaxID=165716 RepID=A0A7J0FSM9_9ERIC|nr:hypothetical protein Acr_14g0005830 [Actinidia rufa]
MSKRLKLSDLAKVVAQKAATSASKGVVISEGSETTSDKRALDDGSKGKQVAQPPESKKAKTDTGASEAPARPPIALGEGAATIEKILAGVILPTDKEKVDRLTFDQVVTKFIYAIGQGVILGSSLAVRSRDFAESALNQKAVAESAEMEMVRAQNRTIELEGALAEEKAKGKKLAQDADARDKVIARLEARISELERSQSVTQGRIIAAFKESDDFLEGVRGSASSYFGDGFNFCKRQLAHQYPDLGVDLEDVEMDHELLAKEEGLLPLWRYKDSGDMVRLLGEQVALAQQGWSVNHNGLAPGATWTGKLNAEWVASAGKWFNGGNGGFLLLENRNVAKSGPLGPIDHSPLLSTVPFMFSKTNLGGEESEQSLPSWISDHLGAKSYIDETSQSPYFHQYHQIPQRWIPRVLLRRVTSCPSLNWTSSDLPIHFPQVYDFGFLGMARQFYPPAKASPLPDSGWYYFKARPEKNLFRGSPSNVKGWKMRFFFASGDEWEFPPGVAASDTPRVPRSWGTPGKSCNKLPTLTEVDAERTEAIFGKIEPRGYFEVSKVLGSRTFRKHFAVGCTALSTSGGDNTTSGDEGEFVTCEDSVEYLRVIRRDIRGAIRRALPGIPDETLIRWLGGKVKDPFMNLLSGEFDSGLDSRSDSISDSELPPELRSNAMSARAGAPALGEKIGGKAKAEKATKATTAKPPTKGVIIQEKRTREGVPVIEIGGGTSSPGGEVGSESMSDASVARRLLTGLIPASDKKEVDQLSENELVAKSFHALGQVVVFASSLALRSQEHLHDIDFHMARADSAELELVKAQKRAVKAENRLAELSEERSKPGTEVNDLKATVAELTNKLAKAKELAIEDFKASGEFKAAVTDSAATYFSDGFEFCKRQLLHQFPNLGVDVANMAMDPSFAEEEEAIQGGEDPVAGIAPNV